MDITIRSCCLRLCVYVCGLLFCFVFFCGFAFYRIIFFDAVRPFLSHICILKPIVHSTTLKGCSIVPYFLNNVNKLFNHFLTHPNGDKTERGAKESVAKVKQLCFVLIWSIITDSHTTHLVDQFELSTVFFIISLKHYFNIGWWIFPFPWIWFSLLSSALF